jgi:GNAT superfamily N-acetyltransferase
MGDVRPLASKDDVVRASGDDVYVRCSLPGGRPVVGWALDGPGGGAVGWALRDSASGWLTVVGEPEAAARLVVEAAGTGTPVRAVTVPRGAPALLPERLRLAGGKDWDWFWTDRIGPPLPGEYLVRWLRPADEDDVAALLEASSPRHSARPGEPYVRRWCGIRDAAGLLVACAAHLEYLAGVPHLASIATRPDHRGRGLGGAVTAWLTRRLLEEGFPVVTLGMYADNAVARRLYGRLGYRLAHRFTSGRLSRAGRNVP